MAAASLLVGVAAGVDLSPAHPEADPVDDVPPLSGISNAPLPLRGIQHISYNDVSSPQNEARIRTGG